MEFVHLQMKSVYSLLSSTCSIKEVVRKAKEQGYTALALTDKHVMYGAISFYKECHQQGIKPIIGLHVSILDENRTFGLLLLAKNIHGYHNLLKISSAIETKSAEGIPKKWLAKYGEHLVAITPGLEGEIEQYILNGEEEKIHDSVAFYKQSFPDFYLSVQHHSIEEEKMIVPKLKGISQSYNIPLVATNDVHYIEKNDSLVHECVTCIGYGSKLIEGTHPTLQSEEYYLKDSVEMTALFEAMPEVIENTTCIADMCNIELPFHQKILPKYPIHTGETADEYLERLCIEGLKQRFGTIDEAYFDRLTYELSIIKEMQFSDYFLIVWDFIKYAHEHGILVGPGRGSAAGSLVAYVLYITDVDPLKYGLLFERFLNPERITMPDIDIDFPDHRRDEVIQYVAKKYGSIHVAQIITFGTLAAKAAIRDVARVMGMAPKEIDFFSKKIPGRLGITLREAYEDSASFRSYVHEKPLHERIYDIARRIEGIPRHTSIHAAGIIISDKPLTNYVALQEGNDEVYLTQYTGDVLEEIGLLKMDFLGLRNLSLLEKICQSIQKRLGENVDLKSLPLTDKGVFELLSKGDTTGIFQLESAGMRKVLQSLKPTGFEDIVAVNALYRPGPMEQIPTFIEYRHGKRSVTYIHPDLKPILEPTYGVILYQEQIMHIASRMAGFALGEADLLRRAVSKKKKEVLDQERIHFVKGSIAKGYSEHIANEVYDLIVRFANYGFNKSHAVAYSMIAYQLAYLKVHYALDFAANLLSSVMGQEDKLATSITETKQRGIELLPPSINASQYGFTVEGEKVRYGLLPIKNVGIATLKEVMQERKKRRFSDLFDFCVRVKVNRRIMESLIYAGCFDEFSVGRGSLVSSLHVALEYAELVRPSSTEQEDMFLEEEFIPKPKYMEGEALSPIEILRLEKETLGVYLSGHPTSSYQHIIENLQIGMLAREEKRMKVLAYVSEIKTIQTKKGQQMAFLTISDQSKEIDATIFPNEYAQFFPMLKKGEIVYVEGNVEERMGKKQFIMKHVQSIQRVEEYASYVGKSLYLKITKQHAEGIVQRIQRILQEHKGYVEVYVYDEEAKKLVKLDQRFHVHPTKSCMEKLQLLIGEGNVVLKN
ncbi:DNA polymerase III subunit alpha [Priestia taiwanensis]|uniref:DNA polymerase III subunit alpha n=1 Tax=Priestia taiwanensis TaxID=1347902 RepID=A0A917ET58_9BACI|nr:DNA polymerase III subunit alpha [Priestia taiwanensis]MBM7363460.1 DNA polymerase-3 subunit alpha [Priestia taiwanensis]GGE76972.1 DNA-directed DNA polymerase [Priestia taiwanensis]